MLFLTQFPGQCHLGRYESPGCCLSQEWSLEAISAPNVAPGTTSHAWDHPATPLRPLRWFPRSHSPCSLSAHYRHLWYTQWTCVPLSVGSKSAGAGCIPIDPCIVWSWVSAALPLLSSLLASWSAFSLPICPMCPLRTLGWTIGLSDRKCHLLPHCWKIHRTFSLPPWG